ncbi:MAG: hypothetical protein J7599_12445 [Niabella sp.]|nr:hypothetical protein [Niabella sp.]
MRFNYKYIFILTVIGCFKYSSAQVFSSTIVAPPSASTSAFADKLHNSISYQTGTNSFSINLFTVDVDNSLQIPISIDYSGSGIKHGQSSGEIGVGWSLSPNYRINRTIYCRPDEHYPKPEDSAIQRYLHESDKLERDLLLTRFTEGLPTNGGLPLRPNDQLMDGEYDIFDYSTPLYAGSFVIEDFATKKILSPNNALIKFDFASSSTTGITSIKLIDPKGNRFISGNDEETGQDLREINYSASYRGKDAANAWPVTKIVTQGNNIAKFKYVTRNTYELNLGQRALVVSETPDYYYPNDRIETTINTLPGGSAGLDKSNFLDSIACRGAGVKFFRKSNSHLLDSIYLYNMDGKRMKKVVFYRNSGRQFLFLDSVAVFGELDLLPQTYKFEYLGNREADYGPDLWGNLMASSNNVVKSFPVQLGDDTYFITHNALAGFVLKNLRNEIGAYVPVGDRSAVNSNPEALSLSRITFPTGGSRHFSYDPNYLGVGINKEKGPGIRISSITDVDAAGTVQGVKKYTYGEGRIMIKADPGLFANDEVDLYADSRQFPHYFCGRRRIYSNDIVMDNDPFLTRYNVVGYSEVTESDGNGSVKYFFESRRQIVWNNAFNVNASFNSRINSSASRQHRPGYIYAYNLWDKPILLQKDFFNKNDSLLRREKYEYGIYKEKDIRGLKVRKFANFTDSYSSALQVHKDIESVYDFGEYFISNGVQLLNRKYAIDYSGMDSIMNTEDYLYTEYGQIKEVIATKSNSEKESTKYTYSNSYTNISGADIISSDIAKMQQANQMEDYILKVTQIKKSDSGTVTDFTLGAEFRTIFPGSNIFRTIYTFSPNAPVKDFIPITQAGGQMLIDNRFAKMKEVLKIDGRGNPIYSLNRNGIKEVLLWGYRWQYPIVRVVDKDYNSFLADYNIDTSQFNSLGEDNIGIAIQGLRTKIKLSNLMGSTFTYSSLKGVTSRVEENQIPVYYDYDQMQRLKVVRDEHNKIINQYDYKIDKVNQIIYKNEEKKGEFIKNGCPLGQFGQKIVYSVPASSYISFIDQVDADAQAAADVAANGQDYANTYGKCYFKNNEVTRTFRRNNCEFGKTGNEVSYTVSAGTYTSVKSQGAADTLALNEISEKGQVIANENGTCGSFSFPVYYNNRLGKEFTKNDCSSGAIGSSVEYVVAPSKYSSTISQNDADSKALNEINLNGQANANSIGLCLRKVSFNNFGYPGTLKSVRFYGFRYYSFTADQYGFVAPMYVPAGTYRIELEVSLPSQSGQYFMSYNTGTERKCAPIDGQVVSIDNAEVTGNSNIISISDICE